MSVQGMVSSRDTTPDHKRATTDNFIKELLDALAEIMDKKIHLENENSELKHKCQSQKQKIEAFKELALGEKAFLLGIIKRECCSACPGNARNEGCNQEHPVREDDDKPRVDKRVSVSSAARSEGTRHPSEVQSDPKGSISVANECCIDCPARRDSGEMGIHKKVSVCPDTDDKQNQTEEIAEVTFLQLLYFYINNKVIFR